jgi:type I restriction enzyme S subunit
MDAQTAALFPDAFEDSELGEIPRGWMLGKLSDFIDVNPSRPLSKGSVAPYLDMGSMPTNSARALDWFDREYNGGAKFVNGDTLLARITPCLENGKTAYVDFLEDGQVGWGSTEYIVLRPKNPYPNEYAYFVARDENFREFAIRSMSGTSGRQRVQSEAVSGYRIVIPNSEIAEIFGKFAKSVMADMKARDLESRTLAALRDSLLPKLLSGELGVLEAGREVESAV